MLPKALFYSTYAEVWLHINPRATGGLMAVGDITLDELVARGWTRNEGKGISTPQFTSLAFCLIQTGHVVKCVQGYGKSQEEAVNDAVSEASRWERIELARPASRIHGPRSQRPGPRPN